VTRVSSSFESNQILRQVWPFSIVIEPSSSTFDTPTLPMVSLRIIHASFLLLVAVLPFLNSTLRKCLSGLVIVLFVLTVAHWIYILIILVDTANSVFATAPNDLKNVVLSAQTSVVSFVSLWIILGIVFGLSNLFWKDNQSSEEKIEKQLLVTTTQETNSLTKFTDNSQ
jgi:hypothetical protein